MDLKSIQKIYDSANFSDEMKKSFPRPESEEDLKRLNDTILNPMQGFNSGLLGSLLIVLLCSTLGCESLSNTTNSETLLKTL